MRLLLLLCALLALSDAISPTATNTQLTAGPIGIKLQELQDRFKFTSSEFSNDKDKWADLYIKLAQHISEERRCYISTPNSLSACEMIQHVRGNLKHLMAGGLTKLLLAEESIWKYGLYMANVVDAALLRDILWHAIGDVHLYRSPKKLAQQLEDFGALHGEISFSMLIEAQLALFSTYQVTQYENKAFLISMYQILNRIMNDSMYASMAWDLRQRVEALERSILPPAFKQLLDPEGFCLLNRYTGGYLYTAVTCIFDSGSNRGVFNWFWPKHTDSAGRIRAFVQDLNATSGSQVLVKLRGERFKWFYHVDRSENNRVAALRKGTPRFEDSVWSVEHWDGALTFRQGALTMCNVCCGLKRKPVGMVPNKIGVPPPDSCQWKPVKCDISYSW
ncbi:uncharacterized protein LOC108097926 [Drosophila ficusphila]|uniref:uncharacterized protein LOC108097926 n=1 Tax=Drosophila ficusphila TaxID=30025 RepID=UPI0007E85CAD|nr:uncharacterized protein LOC108097926 [Drosophila ficusphila]